MLRSALFLGVLVWLWGTPEWVSAEVYDLVLRGGRIVDGTGAPAYQADLAVKDGRIARIGPIDVPPETRVIDATGLIVAPGFIDMMGQTATPMLDDPRSAINLLSQGITTINAGEGGAAAPLAAEEGGKRGWETMAEYFQLLDSRGLPLNVTQTVGHTQVRYLVLGDVDRRPSDEELEAMKGLVREAMEAGAIGVSTALIYPPAVYARTEEIAALCAVAGEYGGRYYTHMRNEGDLLIEAIDEAIEIGQQAKTPVHIFHLKAAGEQNWGKMPLAIARIRAARRMGQDVTADIYPYINNGLQLSALVHPKHFEAGHGQFRRRLEQPEVRAEIRQEMESTAGWENWFRHAGRDWNRVVIGTTNAKGYRDVAGQSVQQIADARQADPWDTFFELVAADTFALPQTMSEANKILAMQQDFVSFCTDVGPAAVGSSASHPRAAGSFPRILSRYVRELGAISLERAVAQASAVAANDLMCYDRGRLAPQLPADIIVFDFNKIQDHATFAEPQALASGMQYVLVNGTLVWEKGDYTGARPGRVLRGPGYREDRAAARVSTGQQLEAMAPFDEMMRAFMAKHQVPGAAVAVTDQGRLVYARGFGYADVGKRELVQPTHRFRVASVSKPITAVAILRLVEAGKLKLEDRVFDILDYNDEIETVSDFDPRQREITIRHLLEHRGGWNRDASFDAMFRSVPFAQQFHEAPPAAPNTVIRAMLRQPLDFAPGDQYAYSNYGYCLLGRVIEKLSGQSYEAFVTEQVFQPLKMTDTVLGASRLAGRQSNEVRYYDPERGSSVFAEDLGEQVPSPYGAWYLEAMDAHGGWLSNVVDLARFACAFDESATAPILSPSTLAAIHQRPPGRAGHDEAGEPSPTYYGLGWMIRPQPGGTHNAWHTGSLDGTAAIVIRRHDGRNFVVLLNTRVSPHARHLGQVIDPLLHAAAAQVETWPDVDLFTDSQ
jgi:N-acyl-D-amino-acid deacylase